MAISFTLLLFDSKVFYEKMNVNFWTKTTKFKLFGKTIFQKVEVCNETNRDTDFDIIVTQDYFNKEFDIKNGTNKQNN